LTAPYAALLIRKKTILDEQPLTINEEAEHEQVEHVVVGFRHMESTWDVIFLMYRKVDPKLRTVDRFSALRDIELGEPFCWLVGDMTDLAGYNQLLAYLGHLLEEKMAEIDRPLAPSLMTATYFETVCRTISLCKCGKLLDDLNARAEGVLPPKYEPNASLRPYNVADYVDSYSLKQHFSKPSSPKRELR
jgi:hypothetical protein